MLKRGTSSSDSSMEVSEQSLNRVGLLQLPVKLQQRALYERTCFGYFLVHLQSLLLALCKPSSITIVCVPLLLLFCVFTRAHLCHAPGSDSAGSVEVCLHRDSSEKCLVRVSLTIQGFHLRLGDAFQALFLLSSHLPTKLFPIYRCLIQ